MENEENRGLIDKKAFKDRFMAFVQFCFRALSLFSISLTFFWTLRVSWSILALEKGRKRQENQRKEIKDQERNSRIKKL